MSATCDVALPNRIFAFQRAHFWTKTGGGVQADTRRSGDTAPGDFRTRASRPGDGSLVLGLWVLRREGAGVLPALLVGLMVCYLRVGFAGFFPPPSGCVISQNNLKVVLLLLLF